MSAGPTPSADTVPVPEPVFKSAKAEAREGIKYPWWFGGAASCTSTMLTHPLDLIKVQMQAAKTGPVRLGTLGTGVSVVKRDGITGLYRGLSAGLARQLIYGTTRFGLYDIFKKRLHDARAANPSPQARPYWQELLSLIGIASTSGFIAGIIGNPADLANVRMQNDSTLPPAQRRGYRNVFAAWAAIAREDGGFFRNGMRGVWATASRAAIMTSSQLAAYDAYKAMLTSPKGHLRLDPDSSLTHFLSSAGAGLTATTLCSPLDVIKTQIMKAGPGEARGILELIRSNTAESGLRWTMRGWVPSFTRLGPQTVATFLILEQYQKLYRYLMGIS